MGYFGEAIGGAGAGAGMGTLVGGPGVGTAVGAGVGLLGGLFSANEKANEKQKQLMLEAVAQRYSPFFSKNMPVPQLGNSNSFGQALVGTSSGAAMYQKALDNARQKERDDKGLYTPAPTTVINSGALPFQSALGNYNMGPIYPGTN